MTFCLRAGFDVFAHNEIMDRTIYIAPIVEAYIPEASFEEKLALTQEFWELFDALHKINSTQHRFDSQASDMVESESPKMAQSHPNP